MGSFKADLVLVVPRAGEEEEEFERHYWRCTCRWRRRSRARSAGGTRVLRATYFEGDLVAAARSVASIPAAVFAPFHHGRNDDWSALATADGETSVPIA